MAEMALPNSGDSGSFGCGSRDQPCFDDLPDCLVMAEAGFGGEFWIFNAIRKMQVWIKVISNACKMLKSRQDTFHRAHENLQDEVIENALRVSTIASDFEVQLPADSQILRYVAAAFSIAGGLVGYGSGGTVNALKTTATMLGGTFAASANDPPVAIDPSQAMDEALLAIFQAQRDVLDDILALAVGGEGDYESLPDQVGELWWS
jgi:hypothetical protein